MVKRKTLEEFIKEAREVHGNKYDYSKVEYKNCDTKVCIICPEHGEFNQSPYVHLKGCGCPKCAAIINSLKFRSNKEVFIEKAKEIHGNKYDYSKVEYINNNTKVCIICPEHGEFWQAPSAHLSKHGCKKCSDVIDREKHLKNSKDFIEKAKLVHDNKYDYSKVEYQDSHEKVCIICPEHGEFWQSPTNHLYGNGCIECAKRAASDSKKYTTEEYIKKAINIHKDKYDYSKVEYKSSKDKICIICKEHGEFWQEPTSHLNGAGCPKCANKISKPETEIYEYCCGLLGEENIIQRDRIIIPPKELDIYIPSLKVGIEYNGLLWHSDKFKSDKNYHINKLNLCKKRGIKLIQIFEDEYLNHKDIVLSKIKHLLGKDADLPKIYGRKCIIKEISYKESEEFLNKNHIQGSASATVYLGCYYNNVLVGVMTFKKEGKGLNKWELNRFASDINYHCVGIGGKLFSYFVKNYNPEEIKSFADRRWTINEENNLYLQLGFEFDSYVKPDYKYIDKNKIERLHKFNFRKQILNNKYGLPLSMTEDEMTEKLGYYKIYDCGLIKYIWKK